jgi:hypothetical protein
MQVVAFGRVLVQVKAVKNVPERLPGKGIVWSFSPKESDGQKALVS